MSLYILPSTVTVAVLDNLAVHRGERVRELVGREALRVDVPDVVLSRP